MASCTKKATKDGKVFYEIRVRTGRGGSTHSKRWFPEDTWSERTIQKNLALVAADFENQVKSGEHLTRQERKDREEEERIAAAQIMTVKQFFETVYIPQKQKIEGRANTTVGNLEVCFKNHIEPAIGDKAITEVTKADILAIITALRANNLKTSSINVYLGTIAAIFNLALDMEIIQNNPVSRIHKLEKMKDEGLQNDNSDLAYTVEQLQEILKAADKEPLLFRALIHAAADTGCRRGELLGLQWDAIDLKTGETTICRNWTTDRTHYKCTLTTPKGKRARKVFLSATTLALFKQIREEQKAAQAITPFVFANLKSKTLEPDTAGTWTKKTRRFGKRVGISDLHLHKLRHTFCSVSITNGIDPVTVAALAGHASPQMTLNVYSHASETGLKNAIDVYRAALAAGAKKA